ncbi:MAG: single-stranded-DNA-specific exonuclease RecJ [Acidiferrobacterales bacterium]|nr:single-stranded-DNA-specific exonuclease RecJ [Acidiferrobacterales bacterium]
MSGVSARQIVRRPSVPKALAAVNQGDAGLHPLLAHIFSRREISSLVELDHSVAGLLAPDTLKDLDTACSRLFIALKEQQTVLVIGDYDTDGATAAVVAILGLRMLGLNQVDYLVPNRFDYGYGLSVEIAAVAIESRPDLVITVDNGISSIEGVALLQNAGIDVIVTDHHLAGEKLPDAHAIVNPNQPGCLFPGKMLAGVGVMFYVLLGLRKRMRETGWFETQGVPPANLATLLDLVALGTVADVVPLDHNNRILVAQGIARIQKGQCRPGIKALLSVAGKSAAAVTSTDLGFVVGPRLNAAGRLDDISMGIECLLTHDDSIAAECAAALHEINAERRKIEAKMQGEALKIAEELRTNDFPASGLCLYDPDWHQGITGLVASRVKDRLHQPVIVFAQTSDGRLTGSARSISGLHIRDLLEQISSAHPGLIEKFGGHAMAAGLTLKLQDLESFEQYFQNAVARHFEQFPPENLIFTDGALEPEFFTTEIAELLRFAAPWGQKFPSPVFDNEFRVIQQKVVGERHLKLKLATRDRTLDAIAFGQVEAGESPEKLNKIKAAYRLDINDFRGTRSLQLIIDHFELI